MIGALYTAISGIAASQEDLSVISNNIANVNTTAYNSEDACFGTIYNETIAVQGGVSLTEQGTGVQIVGISTSWEQGSLESTSNQTDLAISGDGFFGVSDGTTTYYTRAGDFGFDADYNLVNSSGYVVQGSNIDTGAVENIAIPDGYSDLLIEADGSISAVNAAGEREDLYSISIYDFPNVDGLMKLSGNMYEATDSSGEPVSTTSGQSGVGSILNCSLEMSNVDLATEFVDLVVAQKAYQANSRVISTTSDLLDEIINIVR